MTREHEPTRRDFLVRSIQAAMGFYLGASRLTPPLWAEQAESGSGSPPAGSAKATTISFVGWGEQEEQQGVRAAIDLFEKQHPGLQVNWIHISHEFLSHYEDNVLAMVAAGAAPDVGFVGSHDYTTWARDGMLLDIADRVKSDPVIGREGYFIEPQETHRSVYHGGRYGIGSCWVAPHLFYNADIFQKAGIAPPSSDPEKTWTWEHFVRVAAELTVDSQGKHPGDRGFDVNRVERWGVIWQRWWDLISATIITNGGNWLDETTGLMTLDQPQAVQAIQNIADLMLKHQVMPVVGLPELGPAITRLFDNGQLAMVADGSWTLSWMHKTKVSLGVAILPMIKEPGTSLQAHMHAMFSASKQPDTAWQWMRFLASEQYQLQFLRMGLWLPSQTALMTPEGLRKWMTLRKSPTEGIHPEGYDLLVTEYIPKYGKTSQLPPGWSEALSVIDPFINSIWFGEKTAAEAMAEAVPKANAILKARQTPGRS